VIWVLTIVIDVIIPIPLPLSAILILVIGELSMLTRSFVIDGNVPDLGFELFVAVRLIVPLFNVDNMARVTSYHLRGTSPRQRTA
jgi:hypothetical protein